MNNSYGDNEEVSTQIADTHTSTASKQQKGVRIGFEKDLKSSESYQSYEGINEDR